MGNWALGLGLGLGNVANTLGDFQKFREQKKTSDLQRQLLQTQNTTAAANLANIPQDQALQQLQTFLQLYGPEGAFTTPEGQGLANKAGITVPAGAPLPPMLKDLAAKREFEARKRAAETTDLDTQSKMGQYVQSLIPGTGGPAAGAAAIDPKNAQGNPLFDAQNPLARVAWNTYKPGMGNQILGAPREPMDDWMQKQTIMQNAILQRMSQMPMIVMTDAGPRIMTRGQGTDLAKGNDPTTHTPNGNPMPTLAPPLTPEAKKRLEDLNNLESAIKAIEQLGDSEGKAGWNAFGGLGTGPARGAFRTILGNPSHDPKIDAQMKTASAFSDLQSSVGHQLYGSAFTGTEKGNLERVIGSSSLNESADSILAKLNQFLTKAQREKQQLLTQGGLQNPVNPNPAQLTPQVPLQVPHVPQPAAGGKMVWDPVKMDFVPAP